MKCNFFIGDILNDLENLGETFDFAYDWTLLHHIFPEERNRYVRNVYEILNPHGKYLSVCFSEKDTFFEGKGKYRKTPLGTTLYFSSEEELRVLFESYFKIEELNTIEIKGKFGPHIVNYAFMIKKIDAF